MFGWVFPFVVIGGIVVDGCRNPSYQVGAKLWVRLVRVYQTACSPHLANYVRCRYVPTCSEYSVQAVREHGWPIGIRLSIARIARCRKSVPPGTYDPPPAQYHFRLDARSETPLAQ